jgi:hypothetical protein
MQVATRNGQASILVDGGIDLFFSPEYSKGEVEGHKLGIRQILDTFDPPNPDDCNTYEFSPHLAPVGPHITTATSVPEGGMSFARLPNIIRNIDYLPMFSSFSTSAFQPANV